MEKKYNIYLDDTCTPTADEWIVVRSYDEFVDKVVELGLDNIGYISLDHDLGDSANKEYLTNVIPNYKLDYNNIIEKTGMDCTKWLVNHFYETNPIYLEEKPSEKVRSLYFPFPHIYVHSTNPMGSGNIIGYINNFLMNEKQPKDCVSVNIEHV